MDQDFFLGMAFFSELIADLADALIDADDDPSVSPKRQNFRRRYGRRKGHLNLAIFIKIKPILFVSTTR